MARTGLGSDVKNVTCSALPAGRSGGEQPVALGREGSGCSTEEERCAPPSLRDHPPMIKRTLSSVLEGASVEAPVYLCLNSLLMFCREENFQED